MFRVGFSKDIHNKGKGEFIFLGGLKIYSSFGVQAYSDGDVIIHSLSEALLGAMGDKDIGFYFNSKNYEKNFSSKVIIKFVKEKLELNNYKINNIDCMIMLDDLLIAEFSDQIKINLSKLLDINLDLISIKATKSENNFKHFVECSTIVSIERIKNEK